MLDPRNRKASTASRRRNESGSFKLRATGQAPMHFPHPAGRFKTPHLRLRMLTLIKKIHRAS